MPAVELSEEEVPTYYKIISPSEFELYSGRVFPLFAKRSTLIQAGSSTASEMVADSVGANVYKKLSEEPINMEVLDEFLDSVTNEVKNN